MSWILNVVEYVFPLYPDGTIAPRLVIVKKSDDVVAADDRPSRAKAERAPVIFMMSNWVWSRYRKVQMSGRLKACAGLKEKSID